LIAGSMNVKPFAAQCAPNFHRGATVREPISTMPSFLVNSGRGSIAPVMNGWP
jgi:hypothetical protein